MAFIRSRLTMGRTCWTLLCFCQASHILEDIGSWKLGPSRASAVVDLCTSSNVGAQGGQVLGDEWFC